jgi:phosphomevalonate kinase
MPTKKTQVSVAEPKLAVVRQTPEMQLQILFGDVETKTQRVREIREMVKEQKRAHPSWAKMMQDKTDLDKRHRVVTEATEAALKDELKELAELEKEMAEQSEALKKAAIPLLVAGNQIVLDGTEGRKFDVTLGVDIKLRKMVAVGGKGQKLDAYIAEKNGYGKEK